MVSRKAIAIKAGVSQATVTNVFNKTKFVSADIKEKVMRAAQDMGYRDYMPMEFVLLVEDVTNPHYTMLLQGMKDTAAKYGAMASIVLLDNDYETICQALIERKVSGVFLSSTRDELKEKYDKRFKEVGIGFSSSWNDFVIDFDPSYEQLVNYLAGIGHKRIAYLSGIKIDGENVRYTAFLRAMEQKGLKVDRNLIIDGNFPYKTDMVTGYHTMKNLLARSRSFTAVVCVNDLMALGAMRAINESGLSVPGDISVVGCDNIPFAEFSNPPLTTLKISTFDLGRQAIYNLMNTANGIAANKIHISPELIIRSTTGTATEK